MQDGKVGLKGLDQVQYQVLITHLHHMENLVEAMELLLLNITVGEVPQKVIKKKKVVVILIQMKKKIKKKDRKREIKKM